MIDRWIEREGGIWVTVPRVPSKLISELFDSRLQSFRLIWQRDRDGHFQVEFLIKDDRAINTQWSLPFWTDIAGAGIFESQRAAEAHLKAISDERGANGHKQQLSSAMNDRDELTGALSRDVFFSFLHNEIDPSSPTDASLFLLCANIDNLKHFNMHNGHLEGDKLLGNR